MTAEPAPDEDVWWNGLRWVDAARMQIWRFEEAFYEEMRAVADAATRSDHHDDPVRHQQWREFLDDVAPYDSQRPLRVPSWSLHMQVANELDLLIVAIRNVLRAQTRIPKEVRPEMGRQDVLELLRNVIEHWDEVGGRSADTLATDHPDIAVGGIAFTGKEIWIGGDRGVPLSRITAWLWRMWHALVACLADAGVQVPEDFAPRGSKATTTVCGPPSAFTFTGRFRGSRRRTGLGSQYRTTCSKRSRCCSRIAGRETPWTRTFMRS